MSRTALLRISCCALAAASVLLPSCSDDTEPTPDAKPADAAADSDLWPCTKPGQSCNAHDECAIDPICGDDLLCRPRGLQNCSDGLDCTDDLCAGMGKCENVPVAGKCALRVKTDKGTEVRCFDELDTHPDDLCMTCDPERDALEWSPRNGGQCNDGDPCTKDDYCQDGVCKGTDYGEECTDQLFCTIDCDGLGGCIQPKLMDDACLIEGQCYPEGMKDETGCAICDPQRSSTSWSSAGLYCLIGGACYSPGETNAAGGGCGECDPQKSISSWTVKVDRCLIDDVCWTPGAVDAIGCSECDPSADKYAWSPLPGKCKIDGLCYDTGAAHPSEACASCDPAVAIDAWTVPGDACLIEGSCKAPAEEDPTACSSCQPSVDKYAWSTLGGRCKIEGLCHANGALHPSGCFSCDVAQDPDGWTPLPGANKTAFAFEAGLPAGWSETHLDTANKIKWQVVSGKQAASGSGALYYGDPASGSFDNGLTNGGTITLASVPLPAGKSAALVFKIWLDVEDVASFDVLRIQVKKSAPVETTIVWEKTALKAADYRRWVEQIVDLTPYAGQTVTVSLFFNTIDSTGNGGEGIYIDDLTILGGC